MPGAVLKPVPRQLVSDDREARQRNLQRVVMK